MRPAAPLALILALLLALGACHGAARRPPCPPGALCLLYGNGGEPTGFDPAKIDGTWELSIAGELIQGLTNIGPDGAVIPGMATSWSASPDGLTWTFHLRDAVWSDGVPVTADDFVYGVRREVDPKTASASAFILFPILKNAEAVNRGAPTTQLGIEAPDAHTVVLHLQHPCPTLPRYVSGRFFWAVPRHMVERYGDGWTKPGRYVGNGPYTLVAWRLGDRVVIRKNPRYWDAAHVCYREIDFFPSADAITNERRVRSAELDLSTIVQSNRLGYIKSSGLGPYLHVAPESGVTYLPLNLGVGPLRDVRVRQALAMSIDREFLTRKLLRGGQTPAYSFVPPGLEGYPDGPKAYWAGWTLAQRQAEARRLLAAAGYGPGHPLKLVVKHRNSADPTLFLPSVQADWKAIGVEAQLVENDLPVAYDAYEVQDFEVGDAGWISTDPMVFLDLNRAGTGGMNYGLYDNPAYDAELDAALDSPDLAVRAAHMRKAETMLLADMPLIPVYFIASRNLVNPQISGWVDNAGDQHGTEFLCRQPAPQTPETVAAAN